MLDEQMHKARNVDLATYFQSKGYTLQSAGKDRSRICGCGGLIVRGCTYIHFSTGAKGNSIDCLIYVFGYSFKDAVSELLGHSIAIDTSIPIENKIITSKDFHLPILNKDQHRAFAYLNKTRKITKELISWLLRNKLLYQDINGNCVFPWYDENNNIVGAEIVGTSDKIRFKQIAPNSFSGYGYCIENGTPITAFFFESAIDMLSYLIINKEFPPNSLCLSLGGLKNEPIYKIKNQYNNIQLFLCVDNDKSGNTFIKKLSNELNFIVLSPTLKD